MKLCWVKPERVERDWLIEQATLNHDGYLGCWRTWEFQNDAPELPDNSLGVHEERMVDAAEIDRIAQFITDDRVDGVREDGRDPYGNVLPARRMSAITIGVHFRTKALNRLVARYDEGNVSYAIDTIRRHFNIIMHDSHYITEQGSSQGLDGTLCGIYFVNETGSAGPDGWSLKTGQSICVNIIILDVGLKCDEEDYGTPVWIELWDLRRVCETLEATLNRELPKIARNQFWDGDLNADAGASYRWPDLAPAPEAQSAIMFAPKEDIAPRHLQRSLWSRLASATGFR